VRSIWIIFWVTPGLVWCIGTIDLTLYLDMQSMSRRKKNKKKLKKFEKKILKKLIWKKKKSNTSQNKSLLRHFRSAHASCPCGQIGSSVDRSGRGVLASIYNHRNEVIISRNRGLLPISYSIRDPIPCDFWQLSIFNLKSQICRSISNHKPALHLNSSTFCRGHQ
jgi:hypothetical protein